MFVYAPVQPIYYTPQCNHVDTTLDHLFNMDAAHRRIVAAARLTQQYHAEQERRRQYLAARQAAAARQEAARIARVNAAIRQQYQQRRMQQELLQQYRRHQKLENQKRLEWLLSDAILDCPGEHEKNEIQQERAIDPLVAAFFNSLLPQQQSDNDEMQTEEEFENNSIQETTHNHIQPNTAQLEATSAEEPITSNTSTSAKSRFDILAEITTDLNSILSPFTTFKDNMFYEEALTQLLTRLDAVESEGDNGIKNMRRALVKRIEKILEVLDSETEDESAHNDINTTNPVEKQQGPILSVDQSMQMEVTEEEKQGKSSQKSHESTYPSEIVDFAKPSEIAESSTISPENEEHVTTQEHTGQFGAMDMDSDHEEETTPTTMLPLENLTTTTTSVTNHVSPSISESKEPLSTDSIYATPRSKPDSPTPSNRSSRVTTIKEVPDGGMEDDEEDENGYVKVDSFYSSSKNSSRSSMNSDNEHV